MRARTSLPFIARYLPFKRHNLSGGFGGPVIKNRTFFFGAVELLRQNDGTSSTETVESPDCFNWARSNFSNMVGTKVVTDFPTAAVPMFMRNFPRAQAS